VTAPVGISLIDGKILAKIGFRGLFGLITVANSSFFESS